MSLSSAISNALSGLTATTRGTEIVSTNVSNKTVSGYARREVELSSRLYAANGGGVAIDGVRRMVNAGLLAENRLAMARATNSGTIATFHGAMETSFGTANDATSLSSILTAFDAAIASATARPDSDVRLQDVLDSAQALTAKISAISTSIEDARTAAEKAIATDVGKLNTALERVAELNRQITVTSAQGGDASSLMDARQAAIDEICTIVPVVEVSRENGRIALFTKGGATLLDGTIPATLGFTAAGRVSADMNVANGALATISLNGKPLSAAEMSVFSGGSIAANFQIRDELAPAYQAQIDGFAREVYARFADPAVDPTLAAGQHGLFTDLQGNLDPANEAGFANRIAVASAFDPAKGGALWRIRAGLNATGPGDLGESGLLMRMAAALSDNRPPASTALSDIPRTMLTMSSDLASGAATARLGSEAAAYQDQVHSQGLRGALLAEGVDTDAEMEALLTLEKAYAANARVLQTVHDMLDEILRLT